MPLNDVYRILDDSRNLGALELRISGGEPLIRKDLEKIIVYARKLYMDVVILSNLTMLDDSILNIIDRFGLTKVETSIFSLNPEINDSFMGKQGTLKKQINNIKELQKHKVLIKVKTFAYRFNFDELKDMIYFFRKMNVDFVVETELLDDVNGITKLDNTYILDYEKYCRAVAISDYTKRRVFPISHSNSDKVCEEFSCSLHIAANGDVYPCASTRIKLDNIHNNSIAKIWNSSQKLNYFKELTWNDLNLCKKCEIKSECTRCGALSVTKGNGFCEVCKNTCSMAKARGTIWYRQEMEELKNAS